MSEKSNEWKIEWKIDNWFKKTCFVLGSIAGFYVLFAFLLGIIMGLIEVM